MAGNFGILELHRLAFLPLIFCESTLPIGTRREGGRDLIVNRSTLGEVCDICSREDEMERDRDGERDGEDGERWRIGCRCAIVLARHFCILPVREREREREGLVVLPSRRYMK